MKYKDPIYVTTVDSLAIEDEIIPYGDKISIYSERQSAEDVKELLEESFKICKEAGLCE